MGTTRGATELAEYHILDNLRKARLVRDVEGIASAGHDRIFTPTPPRRDGWSPGEAPRGRSEIASADGTWPLTCRTDYPQSEPCAGVDGSAIMIG
jgi:hypothetical protein